MYGCIDTADAGAVALLLLLRPHLEVCLSSVLLLLQASSGSSTSLQGCVCPLADYVCAVIPFEKSQCAASFSMDQQTSDDGETASL